MYDGIEYFTDEELECPCCHVLVFSQDLCNMLYHARERHGRPIIINSGYRCRVHNTDIGGSPTSSHPLGKAVDIKCENSTDRFALIKVLIAVGFKRIGIGPNFIHADVDENKAQGIIYLKT